MDKTLTGTIERITYQNEENNYVVARLRVDGGSTNLVTIVGTLPAVFEGERIRAEGEWQKHRKFGYQFHVTEFTSLPPTTVQGIQKYLGSGLISGIGPVYAEKIVKTFGLDTLRMLDESPERVKEIDGIGKKRAQQIREAWQSQKQVREVMLFLAGHGVGTGYAIKIFKQYGHQTLAVLRKNPYQLADDIWGIGFLTADKIAKNIGVSEHEPARIESGIKYSLNLATEQGHLYLPKSELVQSGSELLKLPEGALSEVYKALVRLGHLIEERDCVFLPQYHQAETELAQMLIRLLNAPFRRIGKDLAQGWLEKIRTQGVEYNQKQKEAIFRSLSEKVLVITGGPGTGKTTLVQGIIQLFAQLRQTVRLAAPTGRAAKRLSETTGQPAFTIHRLLEFEGGRRQFNRNAKYPLHLDVLILDEVSMVDTLLARHLLEALPTTARLILVGDVDQLPSVGAGNVLKEIIRSKRIPVVLLDEIFRQERDSMIVQNAHRINRGLTPEMTRKSPGESRRYASGSHRIRPRDDFGDLLFVQEEEPENALSLILELCAEKLPNRYGYDPIRQIQILTPIYKGILGADNLNKMLQDRLNPNALATQIGKHEFRVKDRVMQIRNNYDKMTFNGDIGHINLIDLKDQKVIVDFDMPVTYEFSELDEMVLAYATTVHKSQGSEFPVVIMPIVTQHYIMLQRNLLYTALTRARELMILIGTKKALGMAVRNNQVQERNTRLAERLGAGL
jgi:exodeoxyribonuclease V alpha subunit